VPLAGTPFAAKPLAAIAFGTEGGGAVWDRTALVVGGSQSVILDDEAADVPPGRLPKGTPGVVGGALVCDGVAAHVEVPHTPALEPAHLTVEAWVRLNAYPRPGDRRRWIVGKNKNESIPGHYGLLIYANRVGAYLNVGAGDGGKGIFQTWSRGERVTLHRWHHLAMTYDEKDLTVYLDGAPVAIEPVNRPRYRGDGPLSIGRRQDGYSYFRGLIDEVRIYDRALSGGELRGHAHGELPRTGGLVASWGFDEYTQDWEAGADWRWVDRPVRSGTRAHWHPGQPGYTSHVIVLDEPVTAHLPYDRADAVAVVVHNVPAMTSPADAWRFFNALIDLEPSGLDRYAHRLAWFLSVFPRHPQVLDLLGDLLDRHRRRGTAAPADVVEALAHEAGVPHETLYRFRREYIYQERTYLRNWLVFGPVNGPVDYVAPTTQGWKRREPPADYLDFEAIFDSTPHLTAYAACWVHVREQQPVVLELGSDDGSKVWVNRVVTCEDDGAGGAIPEEHPFPAELRAGWNEIVVAVTGIGSGWGFFLEIVDREGRGMPEGLRTSCVPPQTDQ
jgi:hypothetical protein